MWESPINVMEIQDSFVSEIKEKTEEMVFTEIKRIGIDVNKEELIKALQYDRNQYEKGYKDGCNKAIDEIMEIVKRAYHNFSGYDLEFMTKYGNKNASQQAESYSTMMMYEIAGEFEDLLDNLEQLKGAEENEIN